MICCNSEYTDATGDAQAAGRLRSDYDQERNDENDRTGNDGIVRRRF